MLSSLHILLLFSFSHIYVLYFQRTTSILNRSDIVLTILLFSPPPFRMTQARLIMMFAEKAGVSLNAQALLRSVKVPTSSLQPSVQVTPPAISQERLQYSKPSPQVASLAGTSSVPSDLPPSAIHGEGSTSDREPGQSSNPAKMAISEMYPMPRKITITTEDKSRHHVLVKRE